MQRARRVVMVSLALAAVAGLIFVFQPENRAADKQKQAGGFWANLVGIKNQQLVEEIMRARRCATVELTDKQVDALEAATDRAAQRIGLTPRRITALAEQLTIIPVAFHVVHDGDAGLVPAEAVEAQIEVLNESYENVKFVLDSVDFTDNAAWFRMTPGSAAEQQAKQALQRDPYRYLNIYTASPGGGLLGWATFPWSLDAQPTLDGAVVLHSSLPGGAAEPYNEGDTAVHEIGHWLGLYHTFQGRCTPFNDRVADTPAERSPSYDCSVRNTCPQAGNDPVQNFMDYSEDPCMNQFTTGQYERLTKMLTLYRPELLE